MGVLIDVLIIMIILSGAYIGFRRGIITQGFSFVGMIIIFLIAYYTKGFLSALLMQFMPFININIGTVQSVQMLNILFYEIVAFVFIFAVLFTGFQILMRFTEVFEAILKGTIVLALPLKLGGLVVGAIQYTVIVLLGIIILISPIFHLGIIRESTIANTLLRVSKISFMPTNNLITALDQLEDIREISRHRDHNETELTVLRVMLANRITTVNQVENLVESGRITVDDVESVLSQFREEE